MQERETALVGGGYARQGDAAGYSLQGQKEAMTQQRASLSGQVDTRETATGEILSRLHTVHRIITANNERLDETLCAVFGPSPTGTTGRDNALPTGPGALGQIGAILALIDSALANNTECIQSLRRLA